MKKNLYKSAITLMIMWAICLLPLNIVASDTVKETRDLDSFSKIKLTISADIVLSQGSDQQVILEGRPGDLEKILTIVENGSLKIKHDGIGPGLKKITIFITVPKIEAISVSGSGDIRNDGPMVEEELSIAISGSGNIHFEQLKTEKVNLAISGSGDVLLEGKNKGEIQIAVSGSGDINCEEFETNMANIVISGSGDCIVNVQEELNVKISGSGDVLYHGSPKVNARASGSGKVRAAD